MNELSTDNILSLEIAEMMEIKHWQLLRKLEGQEKNGKHVKGYIEHLADNEIVVSDFFIQTHYLDDSNKQNKAYWFTKKGCEFIAHKMTGAKGTVFTARYINRFHEMEDVIQGNQLAVAEQVTAIHIPEQSPTPLPRALDWFSKNRKRIRRICDNEDMTHAELYHIILMRCGKKFDLNAANEIYFKERGYHPEYAIDIVGYFPQLEEIADSVLECYDTPQPSRRRRNRR